MSKWIQTIKCQTAHGIHLMPLEDGWFEQHFELSGSKKCLVNLLEHGRATLQHEMPCGNLPNISKTLRANYTPHIHVAYFCTHL